MYIHAISFRPITFIKFKLLWIVWAVSITSPSKIICTNGTCICCQVLIDTWIDTLDQHSIPWSTINQNFIDTSVDNRLTLNQRLINMSVKSQLLFKRCTVGLHSADYQLIIDQVLIEMLMDCQLSISLDANWVSIEMSIRDWLRISIDTQIQMHLLQVTSKLNPQIYPSISSFNV